MSWLHFMEEKYGTRAKLDLAGMENCMNISANKLIFGTFLLVPGAVILFFAIGDVIIHGKHILADEIPMLTAGTALTLAGSIILLIQLVRFIRIRLWRRKLQKSPQKE